MASMISSASAGRPGASTSAASAGRSRQGWRGIGGICGKATRSGGPSTCGSRSRQAGNRAATLHSMTRLQRNANIGAVIVPFLAVLAAIPLLWNSLVGPADLAIMVGVYLASAFGITIGFHRLLTHRAFETYRPLKYLFAVLGSMAVQGPGDPLGGRPPQAPRPHRRGGRPALTARGPRQRPRGPVARARGLAVGGATASPTPRSTPPTCSRTAACASSAATSCCGCGLGLLIPFGLGYAIGGTLTAALLALFWGGLVRVFFVHHITWSINSVCHFFGQRRFETEDKSTNVVLAGPALARRGLAPQPPRVPARRGAGPEVVGDRHLRPGDPGDEGRGAGLERGADHARAPSSSGWPAAEERVAA